MRRFLADRMPNRLDLAHTDWVAVGSNQNHIAYDLITDLFRVSTRGSAPHHSGFLLEALLGVIAWVSYWNPRYVMRCVMTSSSSQSLSRLEYQSGDGTRTGSCAGIGESIGSIL